MTDIRVVLRYAQLVAHLTALDLKVRFAGSKLGLAWLTIAPAFTVSVYLLLFSRILKVQTIPGLDPLDYGLLVVAGLLPWIGLSESLTRGTASVLAQRNLMKSRLFPMELIPVTAVCAGGLSQLVGTILLAVVLAVTGKLSASCMFLPILLLFQMVFTLGLVWFLSCVNIIYRDTSQLISLGLLLMMFVSPIAYTPDMMPLDLSFLLALNPLAYLIEGYRDILLFGRLPQPGNSAVFAVVAAAVGIAGYRYFMRLRRVLPDLV